MTTVVMNRASSWPPQVGEYLVTDKSIYARCGDCHSILTIDSHEIASDGSVSPSVVCPYTKEGCKWHVIMKLDDWE